MIDSPVPNRLQIQFRRKTPLHHHAHHCIASVQWHRPRTGSCPIAFFASFAVSLPLWIVLPPELPGKILSSYRCPVAFHQLSVSGAVVGLSVSRDASSRQKTCHTYGHFCDYVAAGALAAGALVFIVTSNHRHHIHRRMCVPGGAWRLRRSEA